MAYTAEQQTRIHAANAKVASAQTAYDNALTNKDGLYATLKQKHSSSNLQGKCYDDAKSLDDQIAWGTLSENNCNSKGDCVKSACKTQVSSWNVYYSAYKGSLVELSNKLTALSSAKEELKNLLDTIASEVQNDPDFIHTQTQIGAQAEADAKAKRLKIWFWIIATITVGGLIFAWMRWGKKIKIIPTAS